MAGNPAEQGRSSPDIAFNTLKEIPGFDPDSGELFEDKVELQPSLSKLLAIPPEVQSNFVSFCEKRPIKKFKELTYKVLAEKLLLISQNPAAVSREYFAFKYSPDGTYNFKPVEELVVSNTHLRDRYPNAPILIDVVQFGEMDLLPMHEGEKNSIFLATDLYDTSCGFYLGGRDDLRELQITFDRSGFVSAITWHSHREKSPNFDFDRISFDFAARSDRQFEDCQRRMTQGPDDYELTIEGENILFRRFENQNLKDELIILKKFNKSDIIQQLFAPPTLENPFNAPPELDNSWRFANLLEVAGIKWERY